MPETQTSYAVRLDFESHYNVHRLSQHEDRNINKILRRLIKEAVEKAGIGWAVPTSNSSLESKKENGCSMNAIENNAQTNKEGTE